MKWRSCEPAFAGSGRLALGPTQNKNFFTNKSSMALLAAGSGAVALIMAAKAGQQIVKYENLKTCQQVKKDAGRTLQKHETDKLNEIRPILYDPALSCIFRNGFNQHMVHTAAFLAVPYVASQPMITTALLIAGIMTYCGTQYYKAFNRDPDCCNGALALGTGALIGAWLTFML